MATKAKAKKESKFKIPKWWDCQWRRVPCGKDSCAMCGRVNKQRKKHILRGEDPDTMESALADVGDMFDETFELLHKHSKRMGIDLNNLPEEPEPERPEHEEYPLYNSLTQWYKGVRKLAKEAEEGFQAWIKTEAGQDLLWYHSMILVKTARQLDNRWEIEHGDEFAAQDMEYQGYVLSESIAILKKALADLAALRTHQAVDFTFCLSELESLEKKILKI